MSLDKPTARETDEQSIRSRKSLLFEREAPRRVEGPPRSGKTFPQFLRETPPAPLSGGTRAVLWLVGVLVVALLAFTVYKRMLSKPAGPRPEGEASVSRAAAAPALTSRPRPA